MFSSRRVGWTVVGSYAVCMHNRASALGMSISERLAGLVSSAECELSSLLKAGSLQEVFGKVEYKEVDECGHRVSKSRKSMSWGLSSNTKVTGHASQLLPFVVGLLW